MILHVILTSLHQENGYSFPDHLLNGSSHFVEVGWVQDDILCGCCFLLLPTSCFLLFPTGNSCNMTGSEYNAFLHLQVACDASCGCY